MSKDKSFRQEQFRNVLEVSKEIPVFCSPIDKNFFCPYIYIFELLDNTLMTFEDISIFVLAKDQQGDEHQSSNVPCTKPQ